MSDKKLNTIKEGTVKNQWNKVYIYANDTEISTLIENTLKQKLVKSGLIIFDELNENTELIICVGGDGTLLRLLHEKGFPKIPIVGINTGHLGFFQEVLPERIDDFIFDFTTGKYEYQPFSMVKADVKTKDGTFTMRALNEFAIKGGYTYPIHMNISINDSFIERYSGDGLCVATPAGSTAYNYSLGGAIVDPRLNVLQVTPMAPMNTVAYRSLTSSILLPSNDKLTLIPCGEPDKTVSLVYDGYINTYENVESITLSLSRRKVNLVRFGDTTFWDKVKDKFL